MKFTSETKNRPKRCSTFIQLLAQLCFFVRSIGIYGLNETWWLESMIARTERMLCALKMSIRLDMNGFVGQTAR